MTMADQYCMYTYTLSVDGSHDRIQGNQYTEVKVCLIIGIYFLNSILCIGNERTTQQQDTNMPLGISDISMSMTQKVCKLT